MTADGNASRTPGILYTPNRADLPSYTTATVFEPFETGSGTGYRTNPVFGGYTLTASTANVYLTSRYLFLANGTSLVLGGPLSITFDRPVTFFSFVGNIQQDATVTLNYTDGSRQTLNGLAIAGTTDRAYLDSQGRISYDTGAGRAITSVAFSSTGLFSIDALAAAVPEPQTWAMMILGLAVSGIALRRNQAAVRALRRGDAA